MVFAGGALVAQGGVLVGEWLTPAVDDVSVRDTVHVEWERLSLAIPAEGERGLVVVDRRAAVGGRLDIDALAEQTRASIVVLGIG